MQYVSSARATNSFTARRRKRIAHPWAFRIRAPHFVVLCSLFLLAIATAHGQASLHGRWQTLPSTMPINPVHVSLLHNGKILVVAGSGNVPGNNSFQAGIWDLSTNTITTQPIGWDMFCNGTVALPDGRIMVFGGNLQYDPFHGWKRTAIFDPATGKFVDMQDMAHGRWYPTSVELGDGRILTFSGLQEDGSTNSQVEIYKVGQGFGAPLDAGWTPPLYPRLHLLPNGKIFYSGWTPQSQYFTPSTSSWSGTIATTNYGGNRTYGTSVMFPLTPANGYAPKVMIFGGGNPATSSTEIIDLSAATPAWANGPPMSNPRIEMNATMLPNGKILALGGSQFDEDVNTASLGADLYDTATNTMISAGSNSFPHLYHSVSLLLPDGTVWVAGGNPQRGSYETHVEVYSPPYLFNSNGSLAARPTITSVTPAVVGYGANFTVQTPDAATIASVVLMKNGSPTHAFDMDQRMVALNFTTGAGALTITAPPNGNIAPPGYYMLFLLNGAGVPSIAKFVQISSTPASAPPTGTITNPTGNAFIAPGQSINLAGSGTASTGSIASYSWVMRGGTPGTSTLASPGTVTFPNAGIYTVSLTVTDSAGNTDPSPPVRTITVTSTPAPTLSNAAPNSGGQGQTNLTVTLSGTNFQPGPTCFFGAGINVASCSYVSATQLSANINVVYNATIGPRSITVTNPDGQSATLNNGFSVIQGIPNTPPTLTSLSPNTGAQGDTGLNVLLFGSNFLSSPTCTFGEGITVNSCTFNSSSQLTANLTITPTAFVAASNVTVTNADGQSTTLVNGFSVHAPLVNRLNFSYASRAALLADGWSFVATTASGGSRNTEITSGQPSIDYNQTTHPGKLRIQLGSGEDYGTSNNSQNMLFHPLPPSWTSIRLNIAAFNPTSNYQQSGLMVYQDDDNYFYVSRLYGGAPSTESQVESASANSNLGRVALSATSNITYRIDKSGANTYTSYYSLDGGSTWTTLASATANLNNAKLAIQQGTDQTGTFPTVDYAWTEILSQNQAPPNLTAATPNVGGQGQNNLGVSLSGNNFLSSPTCSFGAGITVNSCVTNSPTQITASISIAANASTGPRNISVTNSDGQFTTLASGFTVQAAVIYPAPTLSSANPNSGMQGQSNLSITLTGTKFLAAPTCAFGAGVTVNSCTYNSATQITANISLDLNAPTGASNITVTNTDGQSAILANGFTVNVNTNPFAAVAVRVGGAAYTDSQGQVWSADNGFTGGTASSTTSAISNTPDQPLYQAERHGIFSYQFSVPNATYNITLKFSENYWTSTGKRLFGVVINGTQVLSNFDIVAAAGAAFTAVDKTFAVSVTGGTVTIQFLQGSADLPKVDAIKIASTSAVAVQVSPSTASLMASQTKQFTASVTGSSNTAVTWSLSPQVGTLTANGLYTAPATITSAQTVKVIATSQADNTKSGTATVSLLPPAGTFATIFVNAGGNAYTDSIGNNWSADTGFQGGQAASTTTAISGTPDQALYQTERWGASTYTFTVPAGNYSVILKFAEIYFTSTGSRLFNVVINGNQVLTNFDIVAAAGSAFKAVDKTFPVTVTGSSITIQFVTGPADFPKVSAIQIKQASGVGIQVSPTTATLQASQTQQFTATVSGTSNSGVTWSLSPQVGTLSSAGLYTAPSSLSTNQVVQVTATSVADPTQSATASVTLMAPFSQLLLNAGGPAYTDSTGLLWFADNGFAGGNTASTTSAITNTTDPALYQTERYGSFTYTLSVPNGSRNVVLKFAEIYYTTINKRIFNVSINGTQVLKNFDIVAAAGGAFKAIDKTFPVNVTNNQVVIQFTPGSADLPKISAIKVQ